MLKPLHLSPCSVGALSPDNPADLGDLGPDNLYPDNLYPNTPLISRASGLTRYWARRTA
ncbi:hypothetical protein BH24DEI1_BH24DEI1_10530 [soil metagenome]|jgi:hypothetical protein